MKETTEKVRTKALEIISTPTDDLDLAIALSLSEPAKPASDVVPVEVRRVKALFDFEPTEEGDLAFKKGDIISVLGAVYKDWWKGMLNGNVGVFPINYVEPVESADECRVCFDEAAEYCLVPCGHTGFCKKCAEKFKECPFCKTAVKHPMKLFST